MRDIDDYSDKYVIPGFESYQVKYRRKKILEIVNEYHPLRILEIGCGMEPIFSYLNDDYEKYVFVEPSVQFFDNAEMLSKNNSKVYGYNYGFSATDEIFNEKSDFIICSSLLHEVEEPRRFLNEILKVCLKNTIVHINVPNANSFHRILAKEMGLINDIKSFSERNILLQQNTVFDMESLCMMVRESGFRIIDKGSYFIKPFSHNQMNDIMERGILNEDVLDGLFKMVKFMPEYGSEIYVNIVPDT